MMHEDQNIRHHVRRLDKRLQMLDRLSALMLDSVTEASFQLAALKEDLGIQHGGIQPELPLPGAGRESGGSVES